MIKQGMYSLIVASLLFSSPMLKASPGDFIEITDDTRYTEIGATIPITACCNGMGEGAYCTESSIQRTAFTVRALYISCQNAGIELPSGFFPTNCEVHGRFCNFSVQPGQEGRLVGVYEHVILRSMTSRVTKNLEYGNQVNAKGWPGYVPPSEWGFEGSGALNFNTEGSYVQSEAAATIPEDGCTVITNPAEISGKVALIKRGACNFSLKVLNAQNAGAVAVVIVNNVDTGVINMGAGIDGLNTTLPAAFVSKDDGDALYSALGLGESVSIVMGWFG